MGFISVALDDVKEPSIVPEGEYDLRIVKKEDKESKKGNPMTVCYIRIEDAAVANPAIIVHYMTPPTAETPPDQVPMRALDIKRFITLFGVGYDERGFDTDDLVGATCRGYVIQEEGDDKVVRNKLRLPKLKV